MGGVERGRRAADEILAPLEGRKGTGLIFLIIILCAVNELRAHR